MGFYVQDDYWEAVCGLPVKAQTEILGALARYYFTGEEPRLAAAYQGIFIMGRQRVDMARDTADRKARSRTGQSQDSHVTVTGQSQDSHVTVTGQSRDSRVTLLNREGEGDIKEDLPNGKSKKAGAFTPPSVAQVAAYCQERGNKVDPSRFVDFYASKGWMVGKNRMKDWKAAVRTWEREEAEDERVDEPLPFKFAH